MTSQNSSFTQISIFFLLQRYQPYIFDQYRQPDGQWDSTTTTNPPTVPARGVKRITPSEVSRPYEESSWICEPIGKGEFCEVMLGKWKNNKVAVKVLKDSSEAEAILMNVCNSHIFSGMGLEPRQKAEFSRGEAKTGATEATNSTVKCNSSVKIVARAWYE
ncbi:hypothetical protein NQ317_019550, partial [Molorchus minor]